MCRFILIDILKIKEISKTEKKFPVADMLKNKLCKFSASSFSLEVDHRDIHCLHSFIFSTQ